MRREGEEAWQRDMEAAATYYSEGSYDATIDRCNHAVWVARQLRDRLLEGEELHGLAAAESQVQMRQGRSDEQSRKLRGLERKHLRRTAKLYKAVQDPRLSQVLADLAQLEKLDVGAHDAKG